MALNLPTGGISETITEVTKLLSKAFDFAVDADGYHQLKRENKLKLINRAINEAIDKDDWATCDALFGELRTLRQETRT